jgi:hypothetical protein
VLEWALLQIGKTLIVILEWWFELEEVMSYERGMIIMVAL